MDIYGKLIFGTEWCEKMGKQSSYFVTILITSVSVSMSSAKDYLKKKVNLIRLKFVHFLRSKTAFAGYSAGSVMFF